MNMTDKKFTHDMIVIGAGPAGMSAALTAQSRGLKVLLLDEQAHPGGQIYRHITAIPPTRAKHFGRDYLDGSTLTRKLSNSSVEWRQGVLVWSVDRDLTVTAQEEGRSFQARAPQLIAATGALERPSPISGWTLPGVLNAGAAQILLKTAGIAPSGPTVLVGCGPLLLLVGCQLLDAGTPIVALVETSSSSNRWAALRHLGRALLSPGYLLKGLSMLMRLRKAGIPFFSNAMDVQIKGNERATSVSFIHNGVERELDAETVLLHHGVIPNTQLSRLMRVDHRWDEAQLAWHPVVDEGYQTSLNGFRVTGDGAAISGALAAQASGAIAAVAAMRAMGRISMAEAGLIEAPWRSMLSRQLRIRPFLDALYQPPSWLAEPSDSTLVCRCEEVTAGQIRQMVRLGCMGPNQTKFFSRCGMGPCQGRQCGTAVSQIMAKSLGQSVQAVGSFRIRSPLKPISLESVAALSDQEASVVKGI